MRKLVLLLLACAVLGAQDLPPAAAPPVTPAAPLVLEAALRDKAKQEIIDGTVTVPSTTS